MFLENYDDDKIKFLNVFLYNCILRFNYDFKSLLSGKAFQTLKRNEKKCEKKNQVTPSKTWLTLTFHVKSYTNKISTKMRFKLV